MSLSCSATSKRKIGRKASVEWKLRGNFQSSICFDFSDDIKSQRMYSLNSFLDLLVDYVRVELLGLLDGREEVQHLGIWGHCPLHAVVRRQRMRLLVQL